MATTHNGVQSDDAAATRLLEWSVAVALLVVVSLEGAVWTFTRIFILNFDVAGPNATIFLFVLLSTGWSLALVARLGAKTGQTYLAAAVALVVGFGASLVSDPTVAGIGAVVMVTATTPPLVSLLGALRERTVVGVGLGVLLACALRVVLLTASPYATTVGTVLFGLVVVAAAGLLGVLVVRDHQPATAWTTLGFAPAVLGTFLVVAAGFLVHPQAIARWGLHSYALAVGALVTGVWLGFVVVHIRPAPTGLERVGWLLVFLCATGVVLWVSSVVAVGAFALLWASMLVLLAVGCRHSGTTSGAAVMTGFQVFALLVLFLSISATHWAFVPAPLSLTRGRGTALTAVFLATFPLSVGVAELLTSTTDSPPVEQSRREVLASAATGLAGFGALLTPQTVFGGERPEPAGSPETIRVMTYNLHLFFEEESSGQYSLDALQTVIEETSPDIIAVSESDGLRPLPGYVDGLRWLGTQLDYNTEFGGATRERSYGVGLLSRWPITDVAVTELPIGRSLTRLAVTATVDTPNGPLPVLSTHFMVGKDRPQDDTRDEQARTVVDWASGREHALVMGDFNIAPDEPEYDILTDDLTDAWTAGDQSRQHGPVGTYSAANPQDRIDYIFLQGEWAIQRVETVGNPDASDHLAVVADLERRE
jgi:endonuclease/exonuclease/phosphatase family metal-dependent hydrolase